MKTKILSITLILFALYIIPAQAQKCKCQFDKKDPITGERIRRDFHNINLWAKFAFYRANDDLRFELNFARNGEDNFYIPIGTKIYIKLGNEEILELKSANEAKPQSFIAGNQVATSFAISYFITKEQMKNISDSGITYLKAMIDDELSMNYEIKSNKNKKIMSSAQCILQD